MAKKNNQRNRQQQGQGQPKKDVLKARADVLQRLIDLPDRKAILWALFLMARISEPLQDSLFKQLSTMTRSMFERFLSGTLPEFQRKAGMFFQKEETYQPSEERISSYGAYLYTCSERLNPAERDQMWNNIESVTAEYSDSLMELIGRSCGRVIDLLASLENTQWLDAPTEATSGTNREQISVTQWQLFERAFAKRKSEKPPARDDRGRGR